MQAAETDAKIRSQLDIMVAYGLGRGEFQQEKLMDEHTVGEISQPLAFIKREVAQCEVRFNLTY